MSLPMLAVMAAGALVALTVTGLVTVVVSAVHAQDLTLAQFCRCGLCLLADRLDRHHGKHRQEDRPLAQGWPA